MGEDPVYSRYCFTRGKLGHALRQVPRAYRYRAFAVDARLQLLHSPEPQTRTLCTLLHYIMVSLHAWDCSLECQATWHIYNFSNSRMSPNSRNISSRCNEEGKLQINRACMSLPRYFFLKLPPNRSSQTPRQHSGDFGLSLVSSVSRLEKEFCLRSCGW